MLHVCKLVNWNGSGHWDKRGGRPEQGDEQGVKTKLACGVVFPMVSHGSIHFALSLM